MLLFKIKICLKKNQNAPRPSEHPPVMGKKMSKRLGGIKGCKYKTSSGSPMQITSGQNSIMSGRNPPSYCCCCCCCCCLHIYINRHVWTPDVVLKKNMNASRPSEQSHTGGKMKNVKTLRQNMYVYKLLIHTSSVVSLQLGYTTM